MTKKAARPYRMAPLQKVTIREITDPAEQAALDERIKRAEKAAALRSVLELCAELSQEQQIKVMKRLAAHLPAEVLRAFAEQWCRLPTGNGECADGADRTT